MPLPIPQFAKIKDFSAFQKQSAETQYEYLTSKSKYQDNVQTSDNDNFVPMPSQSIRQKINCPEMSFEQNFMLQHRQAFDFCVQTYMEQIFDDQYLKVKNFSNPNIFPLKSIYTDESSQINHYLRYGAFLSQQKTVQIFVENLPKEQKLSEFLHYICSKSCDEIALEIIIITAQVWKGNSMMKNQEWSYEMLVQHSKNSVEQLWETLNNKKLINFLNFDKTVLKPTVNQQKKLSQFKKFLEFLILTLFLVICEYFNNPFYEIKIQSQLKRHVFFTNNCAEQEFDNFSESQESSESQMFTRAKKKRK